MIPIPLLLQAYRTGFFPMGTEAGDIQWFSPDPRGILPLDAFHVPRRLARLIRSDRFDLQIDRAFDQVIRRCGGRLNDTGNWITPEIIATYEELHRLGFAHSVEVREGIHLVGGLYGVSLRGAFFGESMFNDVTDASKVALVWLVERLRSRGYGLLDIQWLTPHLSRFGAIEIPRPRYLQLLEASLRLDCRFD
jgi:leucyl/phenylalanyl-tRNA--protein transferase